MHLRWQFIATVLGISSRIKDAGSENQQEECMDDDIHTWLRRAHNEKKHGPPTWSKLVEAIGDDIGGQDPAYAMKIADDHPISECKHAEQSQAYTDVCFALSEQHNVDEAEAAVTALGPPQATEDNPGKNILLTISEHMLCMLVS